MKITDVDKYCKGLDDAGKKLWLKTYEAELKRRTESGIGEMDAEIGAISAAIALIGVGVGFEIAANDGMGMYVKEQGHAKIDEPWALALSSEAAVVDDKYQMVLPIGTSYTNAYGQVIITPRYAQAALDNVASLKQTRPYLDTDHDRGPSNGWMRDAIVDDDGLKVMWDFTPKGRELIASGTYRYFSAMIGTVMDVELGAEVYPVFLGAALTNRPAMKQMPEAHLSELKKGANKETAAKADPAHSDRQTDTGRRPMTLTDIIGGLVALNDDDKKALTKDQREMIAKVAGLNLADLEAASEKLKLTEEKLDLVLAEKCAISETLTKVAAEKKAEDKKRVIEKALAEGKILPANRERWERVFDSDPVGTAELLDAKAKEIEFDSAKGSGGTAPAPLSDEDKAMAKRMKMSEADWIKYGADKE